MAKTILKHPKSEISDPDKEIMCAGMKRNNDDSPQIISQSIRPPIQHVVKSWPSIFEATVSGAKKHDMRRLTDRDYRAGDTMVLREYDPEMNVYSGREIVVAITYVTSADFPCALSGEGLHGDFCVLSIVPMLSLNKI